MAAPISWYCKLKIEHGPLIGAKRVTAKHSSSSQSGLSFAAAAAAAVAECFYCVVLVGFAGAQVNTNPPPQVA